MCTYRILGYIYLMSYLLNLKLTFYDWLSQKVLYAIVLCEHNVETDFLYILKEAVKTFFINFCYFFSSFNDNLTQVNF